MVCDRYGSKSPADRRSHILFHRAGSVTVLRMGVVIAKYIHEKSPIILTSGSSITPVFWYTTLRTWPISLKISADVASPVFIINPACFSETCAPPIRQPFRPHCSIIVPANTPAVV